MSLTCVTGQTYSLSGSAPYGIRGEDYRITCQIFGGNFLRTDVIWFMKNSIKVCEQPFTCNPNPQTDPRITCGCINGNDRKMYLNITNVQSTDAGTWTCRDADVSGGSSQPVTIPVYCKLIY
ncbi:hypothetical protein SNE40_017406 [Patella caerulea]|uniref:Ig-like domain-containing protein n=1 Tax=Patella caerulea TaxID=87958 RepID=A0AAN8JAE1_PATCE